MQQIFVWVQQGSAIGYIASALVLATFSMKSLRSLRVTAIASNVAFISYAFVADMRPILILHCILLPVNVVRLLQILRDDGWVIGSQLPMQLPVAMKSTESDALQNTSQHVSR
jgi:hypothetical protein